jgi:hypothetical protein
MARISSQAIANAVQNYEAMSFEQKQVMGDVLHKEQPALLGSVLVQHRLGVSLDKIDFLLRLLIICFLAMKETAVQWPEITEDDQDQQLARFMKQFPFHMDPATGPAQQAMRAYILKHPEKELLAYVFGSMTQWLQSVVPAESDKYLMLAAINTVNCIAYVGLPQSARRTAKSRTMRRRSPQ